MNVYYIYSAAKGNRDGSSFVNAFLSDKAMKKHFKPGDIVHKHPDHQEQGWFKSVINRIMGHG